MKYRVEVFEAAHVHKFGTDQYRAGMQAFYWRVRHANGNKLVTSEAYARHSGALKVATRLAQAAGWPLNDKTVRVAIVRSSTAKRGKQKETK